MTVVRHYLMTALEGREAELNSALQDLAAKIRPLGGCDGVELYQDPEAPIRFLFLERWASQDAHREAGKRLGRDAFAPVLAALADRPETSYFAPVSSDA